MTLKNICILGGGTAGWMTAAALSHKLRRTGINVTLIESEQIGTVGVGEATLPHIRFFNQTLGINEATFMKETNATFKLGIEFCDWGRLGDRYIHPFGDFGQPIDNLDFHHYWTRLRLSGDNQSLFDYSYPVRSAEENKFHFPDNDLNSVRSTFGYAYQFDSFHYARFLRLFAEERGVTRVEGKVVATHQDDKSGFITRLTLDDGRDLEADFFIDCSGFRGLLIEQTLKAGYQDWSEWLPCNRAVAVPCEARGPLQPYTRATARKAGWQWRIPLQHRTGNGHVYCSEFISDEEAHRTLLDTLEGPAQADPKQLYFKTGRRNRFWSKNVVAIGLSAGFLEPLESTSIHLIQEGITHLIELFPDASCGAADQAEYNRRMALHYERVRDFLLLHYVATERNDSDMWRYFRNLTLPDSLQAKIDAWKHRGYVPTYNQSLFLPPSWIAVFVGQNILPKNYDIRADQLDIETVRQRSKALSQAIETHVGTAPSHAAFIKDYGANIDSQAARA